MTKPVYQQIPIARIASTLRQRVDPTKSAQDIVGALLHSLGKQGVGIDGLQGLGFEANPGDGQYFAVEIGDVAHVAFIPTGMSILQAGLQFFSDEQFDKGISFLETMTRESPPDADTLYNLGLAYNLVGKYDGAVIRLSRALEYRPLATQIMNALGLAYFKLGRMTASEGVLRRALEIEPSNFLAMKNLGGTLGEMGRYAEAIEYFRSAHAIDAHDQTVGLGLAMAVASLKDAASVDDVDLAYRICRALIDGPDVEAGTKESAKKAISVLSSIILKRNSETESGLRLDVVEYLTYWIRVLDGIEDTNQRNQAVLEAAEISNKGIDISNPSVKHELPTLGVTASGLSVVCLVYAGVTRIKPGIDVGIDFSREMAIAQANARQ